MPDPSFYEILGVSPQCSEDEIEAAYRRLLARYVAEEAQYVPGAKNIVQALNQAYVVLTDPQKRKQYDYQRFWGTKNAGTADSAAGTAAAVDAARMQDAAGMQPAERAEDVPDWLASLAVDEQKEAEQIPEWLASTARDKSEAIERASGGRRAGQRVVFLLLTAFLIFTLLALIMLMFR